MPHLPEEIILLLVPFAPLFSKRVWFHAQLLLLEAILAPGKRTVTTALEEPSIPKLRAMIQALLKEAGRAELQLTYKLLKALLR